MTGAGTSADEVLAALGQVTAALPDGSERREGQEQMCRAVREALADQRHLVVQAGTGTGKSLAYLVPLALSGGKAVIATATKALQDQLAGKDLPTLVEHLAPELRFAVLKGRSNYLCRQRVAELAGGDDDQLQLDGVAVTIGDRVEAEIEALVEWADDTISGDRADLPVEPSDPAWGAVSVGPRECPGASRCPSGEQCFAERARAQAEAADVVVVNTHLYGLHLASTGAVLPDHDVVVIDEAHQLEDIISSTAGLALGGGRFRALARQVRGLLTDDGVADDLDDAGAGLTLVCEELVGQRVDPVEVPELANALLAGRDRTDQALRALRSVPDDAPADARARATRATQAATALVDDIDRALAIDEAHVAWVEDSRPPSLQIAPVDVGEVLVDTLWGERTVVLTSATLPNSLPDRLGLPPDTYDVLDVGSPFDYEHQALLYCAAHLPAPGTDDYEAEMHDELERLIVAAGGRTLALFTSWRAMEAAADRLAPRLPWRVLTQRELPKPALLEAFATEPETCLFATISFWQGVDVPGAALSLVTIDRLPFPRPDEPLLQARRERAGPRAFGLVDLPKAATMLAQGAGRLIRRADDAGVVAVLDNRLATRRSYRWDLINALPPFRRTSDPEEAVSFLRGLRDADSG